MYRTDFDTCSSGGYLWTQDGGVADAQAWLKSNGVDVEKRLFAYQVAAIAHDGRAMAFVAQQTQAPFASRSLLVREPDGSRIQ